MDSKLEYLQRLWLSGHTAAETIHNIYALFGIVLSGYAVQQQFAAWEANAAQLPVTQHVVRVLNKARGAA